ncbi:MAG: hypothetical protein GY725_18370 [bacterium]|nr:hypothetical protein [bacterium]
MAEPKQKPAPGVTDEADTPASDRRGGTRDLLLEILKRRGESDVSGLAQKLGISGVAVRQHLGGLERDGVLTHRQERRPVGRPVRLYRLTDEAEQHFPQSNDRVALDLLALVENQIGVGVIDDAIEARAEDLIRRYREQLQGAKSWKQKLELLAAIRDSEGFLCSVESVSAEEAQDGARLVHHHCPVASVATQHPQFCAFELKLLKTVLNEPALKRTEHLGAGGNTCSYQLPAKPGNKKRG